MKIQKYESKTIIEKPLSQMQETASEEFRPDFRCNISKEDSAVVRELKQEIKSRRIRLNN